MVPKRVVDGLEPIEIQRVKSHQMAISLCIGKRVLQAIGDALRVLPAPTPARQREGKSGEAAEGWA